MSETTKFLAVVGLVVALLLTMPLLGFGQQTIIVNLTDLPADCAPGQVAIATGTDDTYTWVCGDL